MSNHTFLYSTPGPTKPLYGECPPEGQILMAAVSIPVFWYMLFDEDSLALGPDKEQGGQPYLHLTTPTADGLARAERRWLAASRVFGRQRTALFQTWLSFVRERADAFIHCETAEWAWMFDSHDEFEAHVRTCLAAFDHIPERTNTGGIDLNEWWRRLLGQAHASIGSREQLETLGNLSYCGFAYQYEVPWSEDSNVVCGLMSDEVQTAPAYGDGPADLLRYMEYVQGPVHEVRLEVCHRCGSGQVFRLLAAAGHGAVRTCTSCNAEHYIVNSRDYWYEAKPKAWACKECGGDEANLAVGFEVDYTERSIQFISVGQRCVRCRRMGCGVTWEAWESLEAMDDSCNEAHHFYGEGDSLVEEGKHEEALTNFRAAWEALPQPRAEQKPAGYILAAIADSAFRLGQWEECQRAAQDAIRCGEESTTLRLRLGQALFELGDVEASTNCLTPLYLAGGRRPFEGEDPKYLESFRSKLEPPAGGWPEGW